MRQLKVAPIVEGDGEVPAVPILLRRIATELISDAFIHVLRPIRQPRDRLLANKDNCLRNSVGLAVHKLQQFQIPDARELVLLLVDADKDCAAKCGPQTQELLFAIREDLDSTCVLAVVEYETWFVAAAESLQKYLDVADTQQVPEDPERMRCRKKWVEDRFRGTKYVEPVDQPKLTAAMDLRICRRRSPSFDKLCREIEARFA